MNEVIPGRKEPVQLLALAQTASVALDIGRPSEQLPQHLECFIANASASLPVSTSEALYFWRRLHTDASVLRALIDPFEPSHSIALLDRAIIVSGAAGHERLDLIHLLIPTIQSNCLHLGPNTGQYLSGDDHVSSEVVETSLTASEHVPRLLGQPSLVSFMATHCQKPFILPGYARDWPALTDHPWSSVDYLNRVAGLGRVVPIEVGQDYRTDSWTQRIMNWDQFMTYLVSDNRDEVLYLAQHSLFMQFPSLRDDLVLPDYVYWSQSPPADNPDYKPPNNSEGVVLNAWLGPEGTVSPAHTVRMLCPR